MILVDTSVWIDFFPDRDVPHVRRLKDALRSGEDVIICGPILMEVLQGIRSDRSFRETKQYFEALQSLPVTFDTFLRSADLYRSLRKKGITVRSALECIIAAVALDNGVTLLHNDRDFSVIAEHYPLRMAL